MTNRRIKSKLADMVKLVLKFAFAFALIIFLLRSGRLNFSLLGQMRQHLGLCLLSGGFVLGNLILTSWRWRFLVQQKSAQKFPFGQIFQLTWIGVFFSCVLPGVISGDVIKLVYARQLDAKLSKTFLLTSILLDRCIGLIGLIILCGIFSFYVLQQDVLLSPAVHTLIYFNFCLLAGSLAFLGVMFLPPAWQQPFLRWGEKVPLLGHQIFKTLQQFWIIGQNKKAVFQALGLSLISQTMCVMSFWVLLLPFVQGQISWVVAFTFIPIGFITIAIPLAPAGLGIGHAIFDELFNCFGVAGGASFFNIYFIVMVFINLQGFWPYLFSGRRYQPADFSTPANTAEIVVDYQALAKAKEKR